MNSVRLAYEYDFLLFPLELQTQEDITTLDFLQQPNAEEPTSVDLPLR